MPVPIKVPPVGESIPEGILARWLKKDGDRVRVDEPLFELETDKATGEVPSPANGTLHISVHEGEKVAIGAVVGEVAEGAAAERPGPQPAAPNAQPKAPARAEQPRAAPRPAAEAPRQESPPLTTALRQPAAAKGADIRQVTGTGRGARVTKQDLLNYLARPPPERAPPPPPPPAVAAP